MLQTIKVAVWMWSAIFAVLDSVSLLPMPTAFLVLSPCVGNTTGFASDGDYDVPRPELFVEELNPASKAVRGRFVVSSSAELCASCASRQEAWLLRGREEGQQAALCADCAFAVREGVARNAVLAKTRFLSASVAATRTGGEATVAARAPRLGGAARAGWTMALAISLGLLSCAALSVAIPRLWVFQIEIVAVLVTVLCLGLNRAAMEADATLWNGRHVDVACAIMVVPMVADASPMVAVACVAVALTVVAASFAGRARRVLARARRLRQQRENLKSMEKPLDHRKGQDEVAEVEEENPWQLGLSNSGWSARPATFQYKSPGEYEPGAMLVGGPPPKIPSQDELNLESLLSNVSILGSDDGEEKAAALATRGKESLLLMWRTAPRMTMGSIAMALACKVVFFEKSWSNAVYAGFWCWQLLPFKLETRHPFKRHLSTAMLGLAAAAVIPWKWVARMAWANVEVLAVGAVACVLFLFRNVAAAAVAPEDK